VLGPLQSIDPGSFAPCLSPGKKPPLMELSCSTTYPRPGSIAISVWRSLYAVSNDPEVFLTLTSSTRLKSSALPPLSFFLSYRVRPNLTAAERVGSSSRGVWSPSALAASEARFTRVCLTRHLPTSGFCTLLPAFFLRSLPALFHAGNALGVFLQGFSPPQSLRRLSTSVPFVALASADPSSKRTQSSSQTDSPAYKALLSARIRTLQWKG